MSENENTCPVCQQALPGTNLKGATLIWLRQHRVSQENANLQNKLAVGQTQRALDVTTKEGTLTPYINRAFERAPKTLGKGVAKLVCIDHAIECVHQAQSPGED